MSGHGEGIGTGGKSKGRGAHRLNDAIGPHDAHCTTKMDMREEVQSLRTELKVRIAKRVVAALSLK